MKKQTKRNLIISSIILSLVIIISILFFLGIPQSILNVPEISCGFSSSSTLSCSQSGGDTNIELFDWNGAEKETITISTTPGYDLYHKQFDAFKSNIMSSDADASLFFATNTECTRQSIGIIRFLKNDAGATNSFKSLIGFTEDYRHDDGTSCEGTIYQESTYTIVSRSYPNQIIEINARLENYYDPTQYINFKAYGMCDLWKYENNGGSCTVYLPAVNPQFSNTRVKTIVNSMEIKLKYGGYTQEELDSLILAGEPKPQCDSGLILCSDNTCKATCEEPTCEETNTCPIDEDKPNYFILALIIILPIALLVGLIYFIYRKMKK